MFDRIPGPGKEGRVKITPEGGGAPYYAIMEMADEPTQVGTPLNKATLLSDATAALYGLLGAAVPDDVLEKLSPAACAGSNGLTDVNGYPLNNVPGIHAATVSYTGTGTAGVNSPTSVTFAFAPIFIWVFETYVGGMMPPFMDHRYRIPIVLTSMLTTSFSLIKAPAATDSGSGTYCKKSADGKTISWYATSSGNPATAQFNVSGTVYYVLGLG